MTILECTGFNRSGCHILIAQRQGVFVPTRSDAHLALRVKVWHATRYE